METLDQAKRAVRYNSLDSISMRTKLSAPAAHFTSDADVSAAHVFRSIDAELGELQRDVTVDAVLNDGAKGPKIRITAKRRFVRSADMFPR